MKTLLRRSQESIELLLRLSNQVSGAGDIRTPCDLNGRGVATEPLLRGLLAVVLGDADRFEALWILVAAETCRKSRKSVATVSTLRFDFFTDLAPGGDHGPHVATFIDVLA
jgi:hypothetical protein